MSEYVNNDVAIDWDDMIEKDSEYTPLPEGDYDFVVTEFKRGRTKGSAKMSASPMAILKIKVFDKNDDSKGSTTVTHNLVLNKKVEWKMCEFFTAIGDRKHGEPLRPNWKAVIGKGGRCRVIVDEYKTDKDETRTNNKIDKFYEPENTDAPTSPTPTASPVQKTFIPGKF